MLVLSGSRRSFCGPAERARHLLAMYVGSTRIAYVDLVLRLYALTTISVKDLGIVGVAKK